MQLKIQLYRIASVERGRYLKKIRPELWAQFKNRREDGRGKRWNCKKVVSSDYN
ncbi:unnamed protein product [Brugia timori]|uniref:Ovule protein n=1 Tax=Brugia timori TaxID=42155 RepID=A0A0R3Q4K9_9BILA|nr:unnamed protein product [Brugia timori]